MITSSPSSSSSASLGWRSRSRSARSLTMRGIYPPSGPRDTINRRVSSDPHVLVVDDDGVSRHMLGQMLAGAGLLSDVVASGAEAIAYLESHPAPSAVLLDLVMPEPDGYAVLRF